MRCNMCNSGLTDDITVCPNCGSSTAKKSNRSIGLALLSFFIPVVGIILYAINKGVAPVKARCIGIGTLTGFVILAIAVLCYGVYIGFVAAPLL